MFRFIKSLRLSVILIIIGLTFFGCIQSPHTEAVQPPTMQGTQAVTEIVPSLTSEPVTLELGQPFWIGRGRIVSAIFLPGAKQVAIAWGSGVSLHTVKTGKEIWFQSVPTNLIAFDVQPHGGTFAAALADGSLMTFDAADGDSQLVAVAQPNAYWGDIAWSPDGKFLAFQFIGPNRSDPINVWDVASGQVRQVPDSQTGEGVIPQLIWSSDGSGITVASLSDDCSRFVDVQTGKELMRLGKSGKCYPLSTIRFLPDGKTLAVQSQSSGVDLLRFPTGIRIGALESVSSVFVGGLLEFPAADQSLLIDPNGQWIASRGGYEPCYCDSPADQPDHPLIVWDLAQGVVQSQLNRSLDALAFRHRLAATFNGEEILMFYASGEITRWSFNDPQADEVLVSQVPSRPVSAWTLNWSEDGSHLAFTGIYGGVDIYQVGTGQLVQRFNPPLESPALSPDGRLVALFNPEKNLQSIYQVKGGQLLQTFPASPVLMGAAFSPDGQYLAYGDKGHIMVVEQRSGKVITLDPASAVPVTAAISPTRLIWSRDGQALVTVFALGNTDSDEAGVIVLWKRGGDDVFRVIYHVENAQAGYTLPNLVLASFNPSGQQVALQALPKLEAGQMELVVYDLEAEKVIRAFQEYKLGAWINNEELLAAEAQYDTRLTRIHVNSGEMTIGNGREVGDNAYAPNGLFTAQMGLPLFRGVTIRHWQNKEIVAQAVHEALNLLDYRWASDGGWLASIGDDGTLRLWRVRMH